MQLLALLPLLPLALAQSTASSSSTRASSTASSSSSSASATQTVTVGQFGLRYTPEVIEAPRGGKVVFEFVGGDHSVTQGDFNNPCQPSSNGINSGYVTFQKGQNKTFTVDITNTDPIFFYCAQGSHCQSGMVGVINPSATSQQQLSVYRNRAANASSATLPNTVRGGSLSGSATSGSNSTNTTTGGGSANSSGTKTGDAVKQVAGSIVLLFAAVAASIVSL